MNRSIQPYRGIQPYTGISPYSQIVRHPTAGRGVGGPRAGAGSMFRTAGALGLGVMSVSNGLKSIESMRYGEMGNAAFHATMAAGAGIAGYHSLYRTSSYRRTMGAGAAYLRKQSSGIGNPWAAKMIRNTANFIRNIG